MSVPVIRSARARFLARAILTPLNAVLFLNWNDEDAVARAPRAFLAVAIACQRPEGYHRERPTGGLNRQISHPWAGAREEGPLCARGAAALRCEGADARGRPRRRPPGSTRRVTPLRSVTPRATTSTTSLTVPLGPATGVRGRTRTDRMTGRSGTGAASSTGRDLAAFTPGDGGASAARPARDGGASARTVSAASPAADDVSKRLMVMPGR
ncbi:MAG: hypothetical protein JWQ95_1297 [Sphaerisporangium sp.]|nr:hypothetical protein [Sphaerisporangium sp.]